MPTGVTTALLEDEKEVGGNARFGHRTAGSPFQGMRRGCRPPTLSPPGTRLLGKHTPTQGAREVVGLFEEAVRIPKSNRQVNWTLVGPRKSDLPE